MTEVLVTPPEGGGYPAEKFPEFIIRYGGVYYLTRGVWVFDPGDVQNQDQDDGVKDIIHRFQQAVINDQQVDATVILNYDENGNVGSGIVEPLASSTKPGAG